MGNFISNPTAMNLHTDSYAKLQELVHLYFGWPPLQRTVLGQDSYRDSSTADQASIDLGAARHRT